MGEDEASSKEESSKGKGKAKGAPAGGGGGGKNYWNIGLAGSALVAAIGMGMAAYTGKAWMDTAHYMEFIDGYDKGEYLVVLAVLGFVSGLVGIYGLAVTSQASTPLKYKRIRYLVFAYIGWGVGLVVLLLVSFWLTFTAVGSLELVFKAGFTVSLVKYSNDTKIRASIDALQRDLECCGNYNHTEWLTVSWADSASKTETAVPDSCCDRATVAAKKVPCVNSVPFGESIKLTVYRTGCVKSLVKYYGSILNIRGAMMIGIAIIEAAVVVVVIMEVQRSGTADKTEQNKLVAKKTDGSTDPTKKDSDSSLDEKKDAPAGPMPAFPPAGYGAVPGAYGAPGAPYMYYGAQ